MTQARRAATRGPLHHLSSALTPSAPTRGAHAIAPTRGAHAIAPTRGAHAIEDPDDLAGISGPRRTARLVVPGVAAAVALTGTAFAVVGTASDQQIEAVPAAATLPDRVTEGVSRSVQRPAVTEQTPSAAAQTPIASAQTPIASAMATAAPTASSEASAKVASLSSSSFTPKPKPAATVPAKKATTSSSATASARSTGSLANCPAPIGWLGANTQRVYEASCRNFSYVTSYGGARAGDAGEHGTGHAIDVMISGTRGLAIATFMRANASALGVTEVIYQQKIWTIQRSSDGWRPMEDRGGATANHFDHVHVTTS